MKCPHCAHVVHISFGRHSFYNVDGYNWIVRHGLCPNCRNPILFLEQQGATTGVVTLNQLIYPRAISRSPLSPEVPPEFADDYREACFVLADSPKASAALSRRSLQHLLREKAQTTKRDLFDQIDEVLPNLPSHLAEMIDSVRVLGNFAAHPMKSTNTGAVLDVEPGEAEWLLDTLEQLFDFYFVQPALIQQKRAALNQKLADAGKPPMK